MKKRGIFWLVLPIVVVVFVVVLCKNAHTEGYAAGIQQGIEAGHLYDAILASVISTDELAEINKLRDAYYNNPTIDNFIEWHNKMEETVNSK